MAENTGKVWEKLKESLKGFTIIGKTVRNTQLVKICFEYKQISRTKSPPPPKKNRKTKNKLQNHKNKYKKSLYEQTAGLDEFHTKEFSLFNVYLVSTGQVQYKIDNQLQKHSILDEILPLVE